MSSSSEHTENSNDTGSSGGIVGNRSNKNCWSGYHVRYRNPRNFQEFAINQTFNRWGEMVDFFKNQPKPYNLSQGSLKDLLYGTYQRQGKHGLTLNDLVSIEKIDREKKTVTKNKSKDDLKGTTDSKNEESCDDEVTVADVTVLSPGMKRDTPIKINLSRAVCKNDVIEKRSKDDQVSGNKVKGGQQLCMQPM